MANGRPTRRAALVVLIVAVGTGIAAGAVLSAPIGCGSARCVGIGALAVAALVLGLVSLASAGWLMLLALGGRPDGPGSRSRSPGPR